MSEPHRAAVRKTFSALAVKYLDEDLSEGVTSQERELVLTVAQIAAEAVCAFDRIADALEVLASPPADGAQQSGKWVWVETESPNDEPG